MNHGSGGVLTGKLINDVFFKHFDNEILLKAEDSAVLDCNSKQFAMTTDSFVIDPIFFKGGDIGKLAVCGTVNDLTCVGALPKYLNCGFIIGEGFSIETLEKIVISMAKTAKEANVKIVAGDTKVVENHGLFINTSGYGEIISPLSISNSKIGDKIIVTGFLGEHQAAIMSARMGISNNISSDVAPLHSLSSCLDGIHSMRDITRGGLVTVLNEICEKSHCGAKIYEDSLPISQETKGFCDILGLEPIYMANEGKMLIIGDVNIDKICQLPYCKNAAIIGEITAPSQLLLQTHIGGTRILDPLYSEALPRIC
jgi:hydrogenase expression/formation protein HypE